MCNLISHFKAQYSDIWSYTRVNVIVKLFIKWDQHLTFRSIDFEKSRLYSIYCGRPHSISWLSEEDKDWGPWRKRKVCLQMALGVKVSTQNLNSSLGLRLLAYSSKFGFANLHNSVNKFPINLFLSN